MPRTAVILPVRNGERFVRVAVKSTLQSMPKDSQLVVLDDGSEDGTLSVLSEFSDPRMRVMESPGCGGLANALNLLLDSTDSEFVARMDADDVGLPWRFRCQLAELQSADVVFSPVVHITSGRRLRPARPGALGDGIVKRMLIFENPVAHPTALFRRSAIDAVGGYRAVLAEDYDLWLRLASSGHRLRRTRLPSLMYRHHVGQVTKDKTWAAESRIEEPLVDSHGKLVESLVGIQGDTLSGFRSPDATTDQIERSLAVLSAVEVSVANRPLGPGGKHLAGKLLTVKRQLRERLEARR